MAKTKRKPPAQLMRDQVVKRRKDEANAAWREYLAETESMREKTERLRAARLVREDRKTKPGP